MTTFLQSMAFKIGLGVVIAAAFFALTLGYMARGDKIAAMTEWQNTVILATTDATVEPGKDGKRKLLTAAQIAPSIAALKRTADSCLAGVAESNRIVSEAKTRADNADQALANVQVVLRGQFSSAEARIKALESVRAAKTPELACQAVGNDSKAAWEGWK